MLESYDVLSYEVWVVVSLGAIVGSVIGVFICGSCKKSKVPEHKASIVRNPTREQDAIPAVASPKQTQKNYANTDRWDDLIDVDELEVRPPEKFIPPEKLNPPERPPPPDLIKYDRNFPSTYDRQDSTPKSTHKGIQGVHVVKETKPTRSHLSPQQHRNINRTSPSSSFNMTRKQKSSEISYQQLIASQASINSSPPPLYDHSDVKLVTDRLSESCHSLHSFGTNQSNLSNPPPPIRKSPRPLDMRYASPPLSNPSVTRLQGESDVEVYSPPPIPPRNYLFFEEDETEEEPEELIQGGNSINQSYIKEAPNKYHDSGSSIQHLSGFVSPRVPSRRQARDFQRSSDNIHDFPQSGIVIHYGDDVVRPRAKRAKAMNVEQRRSRNLRGIDNRGYLRYAEEDDVVLRRPRNTEYSDFYRTRSSSYHRSRIIPDASIMQPVPRDARVRYSGEYADWRQPRSPYSWDGYNIGPRRHRYSLFLPPEYVDSELENFRPLPPSNHQQFRPFAPPGEGKIPPLPPKKKRAETESKVESTRKEKVKAPVPKPRALHRRKTVDAIKVTNEKRKPQDVKSTSSEGSSKSADKTSNRRELLRSKIYKELQASKDKENVKNLDHVIEKILNVLGDDVTKDAYSDVTESNESLSKRDEEKKKVAVPVVEEKIVAKARRFSKRSINETDVEELTLALIQRQRSLSDPASKFVKPSEPVEIQTESRNLNNGDVIPKTSRAEYTNSEYTTDSDSEMLKRFKGGQEDKDDQKRRRRNTSGRRSLKFKSSKSKSNKTIEPEVVKVTVLPVVPKNSDSASILKRLEQQTTRDLESLENLQIQNEKSEQVGENNLTKSREDLTKNMGTDVKNYTNKTTYLNRSVRYPSSPTTTETTTDYDEYSIHGSPMNAKKPLQVPLNNSPGNYPKYNSQIKTINNNFLRAKSVSPLHPMNAEQKASPKFQNTLNPVFHNKNKRYSVHATSLFAPASPRRIRELNPSPEKGKLTKSKSIEGKLGSIKRISRTGEVVRIPAEDEYALPYDVITNPTPDSTSSPSYNTPVFEINSTNPINHPGTPTSGRSSSRSFFAPDWSTGPRGSVNSPITPDRQFDYGNNKFFNAINEQSFDDNDDYAYANPIN